MLQCTYCLCVLIKKICVSLNANVAINDHTVSVFSNDSTFLLKILFEIWVELRLQNCKVVCVDRQRIVQLEHAYSHYAFLLAVWIHVLVKRWPVYYCVPHWFQRNLLKYRVLCPYEKVIAPLILHSHAWQFL